MWRDNFGPRMPGGRSSSQPFRSFNPIYTSAASGLPHRTGALARSTSRRIRVSMVQPQAPATDSPSPPLPLPLPHPTPGTPGTELPAPIQLPFAQPLPKVLVGFDPLPYPSPPSSRFTRSSPPSPTNIPPVYSDTGPLCPLHPTGESTSTSSSVLMSLTFDKFEEMVGTMTGRVSLPGVSSDILHAWQSLYPEIQEEDHFNYEYNSHTCRFVIKCATSPMHESVSVFFTNRVAAELQSRLGLDTYEDTVLVSSGLTFHRFTGNGYRPDTQKVPDAYLLVIGNNFPSVVCETGWSESLEDLRADARLWLLGSGGETRVVVVVSFQESTPAQPAVVPPQGNEPVMDEPSVDAEPDENAEAEVVLLTNPGSTSDRPDSNEQQHLPIMDSPSDVSGSSSPESSTDEEQLSTLDSGPENSDPGPLTEEQALLATVTAATDFNDLADRLLDLNQRGKLSKPLLGEVTATIHLFRPNALGDAILETFTATVLPAPPPGEGPQHFALTLGDLLGPRATADNNLSPDEEVLFPLARLRRLIANQVLLQERHRSSARAVAAMKARDVWNYDAPTFAQAKRMKRKRGQ